MAANQTAGAQQHITLSPLTKKEQLALCNCKHKAASNLLVVVEKFKVSRII